MDFDSSSKFIASLAKFLQSLCNGYVEFDKGVEVIGHIYLSVDSDTGKKIDYVLNEKVSKNDNSVTFISNSFHAQPAEKPKPPPKKSELESSNEDSVVLDDSGQTVPSSTNVGTAGPMRMPYNRGGQDGSFSPGSKRPRSPFHRKMGGMNRSSNSPASRHGLSRYSDSGGPGKMPRTDIPSAGGNLNSGEDYDGSGAFTGHEEDDGYPSNFLQQDDQNASHDLDQKPVIDPDISIVKEEYMTNQQANIPPSSNPQPGGPGRGKGPSSSQAYPMMMHENPSSYSSSMPPHSADSYSSSPIEGSDPSTLTRAQQEELEMYYRKGTDQHLTFLRNMREAHAMYPFTGKRDKELFDKALAELFLRLPCLRRDVVRVGYLLSENAKKRRWLQKSRGLAISELGLSIRICLSRK